MQYIDIVNPYEEEMLNNDEFLYMLTQSLMDESNPLNEQDNTANFS